MNNKETAAGVLSASLSVEGNKLIAEFMKIHVTDFIWNEHLGLVHCDEHGDFQIDEDLQYYSPDSSWNDLMPVVEKIESFGYEVNIDFDAEKVDPFYQNAIRISEGRNKAQRCWIYRNGETKKIAIYKGVVEFIKWYNNNSNK